MTSTASTSPSTAAARLAAIRAARTERPAPASAPTPLTREQRFHTDNITR